MIGNWSVQVRSVKPFTIHGDLYYELHVTRLDEPTGQLLTLRVPQHAAKGELRPGDRLTISFLMGQVTSAVTEVDDGQEDKGTERQGD
jgi:hypothetical protein